jgi:hypothetical protein
MSRTRYNLAIPTDSYKNLQRIAAQEDTTIADLLRRATKLLLFVRSIKDDPSARLLVERGGDMQEIVLDFI